MIAPKTSVQPTDISGYTAALDKLRLPKHFLNAPFYGQWQAASGKKVIYFLIKEGGQTIGCGLAVAATLPGGYYYFYCPYGPLVEPWSENVAEAIKNFFKNYDDPKLLFARLDADDLPHQYFKTASAAVAATSALQPRVEWLLDISPPAEKLFTSIHKKARYHINLSERKGVSSRIETSTEAQLETFYELMKTTAARDNFHLLPKSDYRAAFEACADDAFIAYADLDGQPIAAAFCINYDGVTHYVYGCSADTARKLGVGYHLQWQSILHAKFIGQKTYNFGGISGGVKGKQLAGVTQFKKRFGGYAATHPLPTDIPTSALGYRLFSTYKHLQKHL